MFNDRKPRLRNIDTSSYRPFSRNAPDAVYKTRGYKVQSLIRLKIALNGPGRIQIQQQRKKKKSVLNRFTSVMRLKFCSRALLNSPKNVDL